MNQPARYRKKYPFVRVMQYLPHTNCAAIAKFTEVDLTHDQWGCTDGNACWEFADPTNGRIWVAQPGYFILKHSDGHMSTMAPTAFHDIYEKDPER